MECLLHGVGGAFPLQKGGVMAQHGQSGPLWWWYKWIGRDMKVYNPKKVDLLTVLADCEKSLA